LRKVYQRAVSIPHSATLEIWREYDKFEMGFNKTTVRYQVLLETCKADGFTGP
jgi:cleavage stimulation factor subunit 3